MEHSRLLRSPPLRFRVNLVECAPSAKAPSWNRELGDLMLLYPSFYAALTAQRAVMLRLARSRTMQKMCQDLQLQTLNPAAGPPIYGTGYRTASMKLPILGLSCRIVIQNRSLVASFCDLWADRSHSLWASDQGSQGSGSYHLK